MEGKSRLVCYGMGLEISKNTCLDSVSWVCCQSDLNNKGIFSLSPLQSTVSHPLAYIILTNGRFLQEILCPQNARGLFLFSQRIISNCAMLINSTG